MGRDRDQRAGGRLPIGDARRCPVQPALVHGGQFRRRSLAAEHPLVRSPDPHPGPEPIDLGADGDDLAGQIRTDDERKRQRHGHRAGADADVDRIDARRPDAHEHLPRPGNGIGQVAAADALGRTDGGDECGADVIDSGLLGHGLDARVQRTRQPHAPEHGHGPDDHPAADILRSEFFTTSPSGTGKKRTFSGKKTGRPRGAAT